jgi:hypothetical protein
MVATLPMVATRLTVPKRLMVATRLMVLNACVVLIPVSPLDLSIRPASMSCSYPSEVRLAAAMD